MLDKLRRTGRGAWLDEEMARVVDPANYAVDPEQAWRRLRLPSRKADVLGRLKAAARWRELEAQDKDVPRGRIMRDETLADLSAQPPRTQADLAKIRGLSAAWATNAIGARLLVALRDALPLSNAEMPPREAARPGLSTDAALVADILKLLLKVRAKEAKIAPRLIARPEELELLAAGQRDVPLLQGWRYDAFGADALAVVEGRVAFRVENGRLTMTGGSWTPDAVAAEDDAVLPEEPEREQDAA
jgi:ribonuclease D